jgi:hypothetical protein
VTVGDEFEIVRELPVECCQWTLPIGSRLKLLKITSPNRGLVETLFRPDLPLPQYHGVHKVKLSKMRTAQREMVIA